MCTRVSDLRPFVSGVVQDDFKIRRTDWESPTPSLIELSYGDEDDKSTDDDSDSDSSDDVVMETL